MHWTFKLFFGDSASGQAVLFGPEHWQWLFKQDTTRPDSSATFPTRVHRCSFLWGGCGCWPVCCRAPQTWGVSSPLCFHSQGKRVCFISQTANLLASHLRTPEAAVLCSLRPWLAASSQTSLYCCKWVVLTCRSSEEVFSCLCLFDEINFYIHGYCSQI